MSSCNFQISSSAWMLPHTHSTRSNYTYEMSQSWPGCLLSRMASGSSCRETQRWAGARSAIPVGQRGRPGTWRIKEGGFAVPCQAWAPCLVEQWKTERLKDWKTVAPGCRAVSYGEFPLNAYRVTLISSPALETAARPAGAVYRKLPYHNYRWAAAQMNLCVSVYICVYLWGRDHLQTLKQNPDMLNLQGWLELTGACKNEN